MARYNKMNQTVLLRTPESSKLNQKYHIAIQSIAVPRIPGHTRHRTNKAAVELDSKDPKPADTQRHATCDYHPKKGECRQSTNEIRAHRNPRHDPISTNW